MKDSLSRLQCLVRALGELWKMDMLITVSVILQNMVFECEDWGSESDASKYLDILKQFKEYNPENHVLQWAYDEAEMIVQAHFMLW